MPGFHTLTIVKNKLITIPFEDRQKVIRDLRSLISKYGLHHTNGLHEKAARSISRNKLVDRVVITWVTEIHYCTYRRGKEA